ncbi:MAG: redoxin domain-containing protein [Bacteroidales bacterium]|nr:redoxin domain-containing protein [Bacteroidales bacterium]
MKRIVLLSSITAALTLPFSCSVKEIQESSDSLKTISKIEASIDDAPVTKAHLEGTDKVKWNQWDAIGIYSDTDNPVLFTTEGDGVFQSSSGKSVSGHEFYAYYPYFQTSFSTGNRKELRFDNNFPSSGENPYLNLPMIAKSDGSALSFKHACGVLHFSFTGTQVLKSIQLRANGSESIAGTGTINLDEDIPVLKFNNGGLPFMTMALGEPVQLTKDKPFDIWFGLPPITLSQGFTLTMEYEGGSITKMTDKQVIITRATIKNYSVVDLEQLIEDGEAELAAEREALIALYNATDGPHWKNNTNWCSDKPLTEWYNVYIDQTGHVSALFLGYNGLNGALPDELANLKRLTYLDLVESEGYVSHLDPIFELDQLTYLRFGIGNRWSDFDVIKNRMISIPADIGKLKNLQQLMISGINDDLPEEFFRLENLEKIQFDYFISGKPLQRGFGKLKKLKSIQIGGSNYITGTNSVCGVLPDDIFDLENLEFLEIYNTNIGGELSPRIGEFKHLYFLGLQANEFSGPLPAELANLTLINNGGFNVCLNLYNNHFSGKIPESFRYWPEWQQLWGYVISGNNLEFSEVMPTIPKFEATTLDGEKVSSSQVVDRELTMLFQFASWCPFSPTIISELKDLYPAYKDKGFEVLCYSSEDDSTVRVFAESSGFTWPTFVNSFDSAGNHPPIGIDLYPVNLIPCITIFDKTGQLVYYQFGIDGNFVAFIENYLGESGTGLYESSDYSADGTVHTLQTATIGAGIDIVLMGDGYSDRLIADGTYESTMQRGMDAFFAEEPYKSFRDCFNVYYVDVVSKNERYSAETALSTWYGTGTAVGGNDAKVIEYARKVIPDTRMDEATVIVLMNRDYYAGTCYMYPPAKGDYGSGLSISYFPVSSFEATFSGLVSHEAGGHGFGKLADEYYYASNGAIPQEKIDEYRATATYGWWRNGDFTSDPAAVKWSQFLADNRYGNEGLGVYEGAFTYYYGAWRPTRNSIMNNNTGGFNAPSRYAIWYRIGKLAYGAGWNGTYEDFVAWDAINRTPAAHARRKAKQQNYVEKDFQPLAPPVVIHQSWRDLKR